MDNIFKFPQIVKKDLEESKYISDIDYFVDTTIEQFLIESIRNIDGIDIDQLTKEDYKTQKVLAFLRETMVATIKKLQNEEHGIQEIAYDVIYFTEDAEERIIDLEDV